MATSIASPSAAGRRYALLVLAVAYMFNFIDRTILSILLPSIRNEFHAGDAMLGFLAGPAFALFYVALGVPIARLADRVNRRNLIALAVALWSAMTVLCGMAANIWQLALARVGVGIGEAGGNPPSLSIIADLYPPETRSAAVGLYTIGISAGIMIAFMSGGWIVGHIGWREAFYIVGLPGLGVALLVRFALREPVRGESEARSDSGDRPPISAVLRFLMRRKSFLHMALAAGLCSFVGYSVVSFLPSLLQRSFAVDITTVGVWLGLIYGPATGFGFYMGGVFCDRLGRRGYRRSLSFISLSTLVTALFYVVMFLAPSATMCLFLSIVPTATSSFYLAPVLAQTQGLVSLRMRAVAASFFILVINSIGLVLGPWMTGLASDALAPVAGAESMRYSLLAVSVLLLPWSAWHFLRASREIEPDLGRAGDLD